MPSVTITTTAANAQRIIAALDHGPFERLDGEADMDFFKRWLRFQVLGMVHQTELLQAQQAVDVAEDIVT